MKRKIDWLNHALEFIVVLIGILIAFQLNKCADDRTTNKLIRNHLSYIEVECQENEKKLSESIAQIKQQISFCESLLSEISAAKNPVKIRDFSMKLLDLRNADLSSNAFEVLTQSGDIRFLKDYNMKRSIISMYDSFDSVEKINESIQKLYDNHFYPYLKSNFDLVNWNQIDMKSKAEEERYYSKEFANTISTYQYLLYAKQNIYVKEKELIGKYLEK